MIKINVIVKDKTWLKFIKNPESSYTKKLVRAASPGWLNEIIK